MKRIKYKFLIRLRKLGMLCKKPVYKKPVVKVGSTVYPDGEPKMSPNGTGQWYGLVEKKENMNTKISAIVEATKTADMYYDMTDTMLEEYIIRRFKCTKYIAKQAVKKLRDEKNS